MNSQPRGGGGGDVVWKTHAHCRESDSQRRNSAAVVNHSCAQHMEILGFFSNLNAQCEAQNNM